MRIIAGRFKGQEIKSPKNANLTRPTTDRAKEAIFSHLEAIGSLDKASVADVYAGTGALGFEALSRGAQAVTYVEAHAQIAALITQTAQGLKESGQRGVAVRILRTTAEKFCARVSNTKMFDLVFMDPPYAVSTQEVNEQLEQLSSAVTENGIIMVERSARSEDITAPEDWQIYLRKEYGETAVFYLERG